MKSIGKLIKKRNARILVYYFSTHCTIAIILVPVRTIFTSLNLLEDDFLFHFSHIYISCLSLGHVFLYLSFCSLNSAGKSFVAEILMLRRVIDSGKIALLVLPYVSICVEKVVPIPFS